MNGKSTHTWIVTYTGKKFFPLQPNPEDICIEDIAHALSNMCRFTGHVSDFHSVAQHSYNVSIMVGEPYRLTGLLHDASEAYLMDLPTPLKHSVMLEGYRVAERLLQGMIFLKYGILYSILPEPVKAADEFMTVYEGMSLMPEMSGSVWTDNQELVHQENRTKIVSWSPKKAEEKFLQAFRYYTRQI